MAKTRTKPARKAARPTTTKAASKATKNAVAGEATKKAAGKGKKVAGPAKKAAGPAKKTAPGGALASSSSGDERRPDAVPGAVSTHARKLAKQIRTDLELLQRAKVTAADADQLESLAASLDARQSEWTTLHDARGQGAVARTRLPLRAGRDHLFAALRTFADDSETTQRALDDIADVQGDDDLASDTTRLLALAKKHRRDLDGTDVTEARVTEVQQALAAFQAARGGERGEGGSAQAEGEALRKARRTRDRAFWELADHTRRVLRRAQYALRDDPAKRGDYTLYRRSSTTTAAEPIVSTEPSGEG